MADTLEQARLRDIFIKEELPKIKIEGIDVDKVYVDKIIENAPERGKIIDIGTGNAHIPVKLINRNRNLEIFAIDLSKASVRIAKENCSFSDKIHVLRADGHNLPFRDSVFDEVIVRLAPHSIKEAYRVLKEGRCYIHRACGIYNCWKEIHEIFGERALPYATAEWWKTSEGRLERYEMRGFKIVYEMSFLVKKYYTMDQIVMEMKFNPIVRDFDPKKDKHKLKELERKYKTKWGIRITGDPLILFARK